MSFKEARITHVILNRAHGLVLSMRPILALLGFANITLTTLCEPFLLFIMLSNTINTPNQTQRKDHCKKKNKQF